MNILLVNYYGPARGGAGVSTLYLARGLKKAGHRVFMASTAAYAGIDTFIFGKFRFWPVLRSRDAYLSRFLAGIIGRERVDIVHSTECRFTPVGCLAAARAARIPCVLHFRGYWFCCLKGDLLYRNKDICEGLDSARCMRCGPRVMIPWEWYKFRYFGRKAKFLEKAQAKIAVSETVRERMAKFGITSGVRVIGNPIIAGPAATPAMADNKYYTTDMRGRKIVVFAGKLIYHRGIKVLMDVAREIKSGGRGDIMFLLAGGGEEEKYCRDYIERHGLGNVKLIGAVPHEDIGLIYSLSDMVIFPSLLPEPFGRVTREAMAWRKPVIASDLGGNRDAVADGLNGYLVNPRDINGYAEKILRLADNGELRKRMGEEGAKSTVSLSPEKIARSVLSVYEDCLRRGP